MLDISAACQAYRAFETSIVELILGIDCPVNGLNEINENEALLSLLYSELDKIEVL